MSQSYTVAIEVRVFDEALLIKKANEHASRPGSFSAGEEITDVDSALVMLLDPAGGGDAYAGPVNEAGFEVIQTSVDSAPAFGALR